jgi:protease IV
VFVSARRGVFLVVFLLLIAVAVSAGGLLLVAIASGPPPSVPSNAALYLDVDAPFSEIEPSDVFSQFVERPQTLRSTIQEIRSAALDSRIRTLVITPHVAGALWGQIQEVREAIVAFRSSGKLVTAYLEAGNAQEYYLASAADRIVMMPAGQLDLSGLATYELFFRGALDKLGVYPDLLHIGDYKTASNTFTEKTFTSAHREMSASLNKDWFDEMIRAIAESRKKTEQEVRAAIDGGPYLADGAEKAGLIDQLGYEDQLDDDPPIAGTRRLDEETWARVPPPAGERVRDAKIALLYAVGTIASGKSAFDSPTGLVLGSDTFVQWIRKVRIDPAVRAVVVRIDSPGGSAIASEVIWRELMLTRDVKPVIVSMGDVAASGGYYIAAPAQVIVAEPGTLTGSIGIVTGKLVLAGALDKLGVGTGTVSDGRFADIYSPFRPFSREERARVEDQMQATYELFLSRVAQGRNSTTAKIDSIAQGRVWTGHQARELGLVDEIGGLDAALRIAKQRAKLDPAKDVDLLVYPAKRSFYEIISNPFGSSAAAGLDLFFRRPDARVLEAAASTFARFRRGEPLALMPNVFLN